MRPSTKRNLQFMLCIAIGSALLAYVSWNEAGGQSPDPTPVCTVTPDGEFCTSSVATTATPAETPVPPTVQSTLTPFEPTSTISPLPTPTNTRRPRPTIVLTPVRVGSNAHLPIIYR